MLGSSRRHSEGLHSLNSRFQISLEALLLISIIDQYPHVVLEETLLKF